MEQRRWSQPALIAIAVAIGILWAIRPAHPTALRVLVDVIGIVMGVGWIVIAVSFIRSTTAWLRGQGWREMRPGRSWTLETTMPLLVCLGILGLVAVLVTQLT